MPRVYHEGVFERRSQRPGARTARSGVKLANGKWLDGKFVLNPYMRFPRGKKKKILVNQGVYGVHTIKHDEKVPESVAANVFRR